MHTILSLIKNNRLCRLEDMMSSMGFDTAAHAKEAQAVYYPEKLHIIGVDMKRPEIMIDGEIFELISLEGHSVGHVGVVTPDGICCLCDAIVSEDVLSMEAFFSTD